MTFSRHEASLNFQNLLSDPHNLEEIIECIVNYPELYEKINSSKESKWQRVSLWNLIHHVISENGVDFENSIAERVPYPVMIVKRSGLILQTNSAAVSMLGAQPNGNIKDLVSPTWRSGRFYDINSSLMALAKRDTIHQTIRLNWLKNNKTLSTTFVCAPPQMDTHEEEILIISGSNLSLSEGRRDLTGERSLSETEAQVLEMFLLGETLDEISQSRGRSLATIRKQFYTICQKFGVSSQAELMHTIAHDSFVENEIQSNYEKIHHPLRRSANVMRPGGRAVETILAGDHAGKPLVVVPGFSLKTFPPKAEKYFKENEILAVTVSAPGFGETSPEHKDQDEIDCFCQDIIAILDQLSIEKASILVSDFGFRAGIYLSKHYPDRVSQIIAHSVILPPHADANTKTDKNLMSLIQKLKDVSDTAHRFAVSFSVKAFSSIDVESAYKIVYRRNPKLQKRLMDSDVYSVISDAYSSVFCQSPAFAERAYFRSQCNWADDILECKSPVKIIGGLETDTHEIESIKNFSSLYDKQIEFNDLSRDNICVPQEMYNHIAKYVQNSE